MKWLSLCEIWYNSNWHSSLGKSSFEVIYGSAPRYFGISAFDTIAPPDLQQWLESRQTVTETVRQHLLRAQQRMKSQADKKRTERILAVGDLVFLRLQPYAQLSVASRANHKLAFKFYGPFKILEKIGEVIYRLELPDTSRIHLVFHVHNSRNFLLGILSVTRSCHQLILLCKVPRVLQHRVRQVGNRSLTQGLVEWSDSSPAAAIWEDLEFLRQQFPCAPAWGQAGIQEGGMSVSPCHLLKMIKPLLWTRMMRRQQKQALLRIRQ